MAPTMLEELCKRIKHCCATLRRSRKKKCWELLAEKFDRFETLRNNTQQHPTTCYGVCKRTQHVTSDNVGCCWPTMLRPFVRGLIEKISPNVCSKSQLKCTKKVHFRLTCVAQKRRCLTSLLSQFKQWELPLN